jgi:hypothetical protein
LIKSRWKGRVQKQQFRIATDSSVVLSGKGVATLHKFNGNNDNSGCLADFGAARKIVMEVPLLTEMEIFQFILSCPTTTT